MTDHDARRIRLYPDSDPSRSGRIGYLCAVCSHEEICPRYGMPESGFQLSNMSRGAAERVVWVCSRTCLIELAAGSL